MNASAIPNNFLGWRARETAVAFAVRPLHAVLSAPVVIYLITLTVMLFRPPDLDLYSLDRIAFGVLITAVSLRALIFRETWSPPKPLVWSMIALVALVLVDLLSRPFEIQVWSVAAAKYFVPYCMFYLAGLVYRTPASRRHLETYSLAVLAYLIYLALASLTHLDGLVFPRFILDPTLGLNAMRARGPFLQPVANGAALSCLGLIALDAFGRGRLRGAFAWLLLGSLPFSILATLTRSVWLGFGVSIVLLLCWTPHRHVRKVCWGFVIAGILALLVFLLGTSSEGGAERLRDGETINFRVAAYEAGWTMFQEHPWIGWGASRVQTELADRIEGFHGEVFVIHNTYFEILLEHGVMGSILFLWLVSGLVNIGRRVEENQQSNTHEFLSGAAGKKLWLLLLSVYIINAIFVVMNYQFVNGLLFTIAGIVASQNQETTRGIRSEVRCRT